MVMCNCQMQLLFLTNHATALFRYSFSLHLCLYKYKERFDRQFTIFMEIKSFSYYFFFFFTSALTESRPCQFKVKWRARNVEEI